MTGETVIAFRGTEGANGSDWAANINGLTGVPNLQYKTAADLTRIIKQGLPDRKNVSLTGHSLGGALATYASPQPSPHFFSCDSKAVGLDAKSPRHLQREAGPTDRVIPRVT